MGGGTSTAAGRQHRQIQVPCHADAAGLRPGPRGRTARRATGESDLQHEDASQWCRDGTARPATGPTSRRSASVLAQQVGRLQSSSPGGTRPSNGSRHTVRLRSQSVVGIPAATGPLFRYSSNPSGFPSAAIADRITIRAPFPARTAEDDPAREKERRRARARPLILREFLQRRLTAAPSPALDRPGPSRRRGAPRRTSGQRVRVEKAGHAKRAAPLQRPARQDACAIPRD